MVRVSGLGSRVSDSEYGTYPKPETRNPRPYSDGHLLAWAGGYGNGNSLQDFVDACLRGRSARTVLRTDDDAVGEYRNSERLDIVRKHILTAGDTRKRLGRVVERQSGARARAK